MNRIKIVKTVLAGLVVAVITPVCFHSLDEIHYLKSFFPESFTVTEAFQAAVVEVIKVGFIAFPLILSWLFINSIFKDK